MTDDRVAPIARDDRDGPPATDWTLFRAMLREEWRMHADLFGGKRFAAFPVLVTVLTAVGVHLLAFAGVDLATAVGGVHALVFLFGLQTGTVVFLGREAMRNLLGDRTLLVFSSRTLPVAPRRALGVFVVKDLCYYAVLFMAPLAVGFVPQALAGSLSLARVPLLWLTLTATFAYGVAVTLALVALSTRGVSGRAVAVALAAAAGLALAAGANPLRATPYALYADPTPAALAGLLPVPVLALFGLWLHDPEHERPSRSATDAFSRWRARLDPDRPAGVGDDDGLVTRSLLDVHRSSGGFVKVAVSAGVLFAVSAFLVELVAPIVGTRPSTGVTFGALLGLSAFTTFNWLTQFDDPGEYLRLPLTLEDLFAAKLRAFLVLSVPVGLAFLGLAVALFGVDPLRPLEVLAGALLLVGLQVYLFGLVVYLTGSSPNEFLFDAVLFAAFGAAVAVPLVPVLVVGLVVTPVPPAVLAGLAVAAVLLAAVGLALYHRGVPGWERELRAGSP